MDRPVSNPRKVLKSPTVRRRSKQTPLGERVHLEKVIGLTGTSNAALDFDPNTSTIAYPAGCCVVLYNTKRNRQSHIFNTSHKTITCLAFSSDGKHLVTGESGHQPRVRVWDLDDKVQVAEFLGHKFSINCVAFHPTQKYVVSIGSQHDMAINVWNWRTNSKVASNKIACKVTDIAFSEDGSTFVTVGNRHVKFWYMNPNKSRVKETVPLNGRSGILEEHKNNFFCSVGFGHGTSANKVFCVTKSGLLCEFNEKRLLDKWVELKVSSANCLTVASGLIYVGCSDGIIRVFSADTMHFVSTLPKPHYLGVDVAQGIDSSHIAPRPSNPRYPDATAVAVDTRSGKLSMIYNDHSLYIWDVKDIRKVGKSRSFLFHSGCIWDLEVYPNLDNGSAGALPAGSFITCSSDDTIRVWNVDSHMIPSATLQRNIFSHDLLKVIYTDSELTNLKEVNFNPAGKTDKTDTQCLEKNGVRAVRVSPDGQHLASGDRMGNVRIHDLSNMKEENMLEAHDSEVLCLEYTEPQTGVNLLASASRDRLIHVFDRDQDYGLLQTLDDHSSAITSARFLENDGQLHMLSCGADKSLLFRTAQQDPDLQFVLNRHLVAKTTFYDMDVDATKKFVATACQDRNIRIYNIKNGKQKKTYKGSIGDDGTLIKVQLDPSGAYVATSCSDKNLALYEFFSGECMATMFGHSELVTGIKFMNNMRHVISVSGDGCIFVWRLPLEFTQHMQRRMVELGKMAHDPSMASDPRRGTFVTNPSINLLPATPVKPDHKLDEIPVSDHSFKPASQVLQVDVGQQNGNGQNPTSPHRPGYRFSVGQLPAWAKKQVMQEPGAKPQSENTTSVQAKGRWAQRIDSQPGIVMKSMLDDNNTLQQSLQEMAEKRRLSIEDQMDGIRRETMVIGRSEHKLKIPVIADDENNQDDEEDDEFCSNRDQVERLFDDDATSHVKLMGDGKITMSRGSDPYSRPGGRTLDPGLGRYSDTGILSKGVSLDEDDEADGDDELDNKEVIYFPTDDDGSESSETIASSFRVFEGDTASYKDGESEGTDPQSLSDDESSSEPPTPTANIDIIKDFAEETEREIFLRNNFENLDASPAPSEAFSENLESLEEKMNSGDGSQFYNPRLSISSRFLSRAQQQHLRNVAARAQQRSRSQSPSSVNSSRRNSNDEGRRTPQMGSRRGSKDDGGNYKVGSRRGSKDDGGNFKVPLMGSRRGSNDEGRNLPVQVMGSRRGSKDDGGNLKVPLMGNRRGSNDDGRNLAVQAMNNCRSSNDDNRKPPERRSRRDSIDDGKKRLRVHSPAVLDSGDEGRQSPRRTSPEWEADDVGLEWDPPIETPRFETPRFEVPRIRSRSSPAVSELSRSPPTRLSRKENQYEHGRSRSIGGRETPTRSRNGDEPGVWSRRRSEQVGPSWARSQTNGRSASRGRLSVDTHFKPLRENPKEEASSMSSSRKWKSMMDVTGRDNNTRSDSSRTNIDSGSSTLPRSKTPNLMRRLNSYPSPTRYGNRSRSVSKTEMRLESPVRQRSRSGREEDPRRSRLDSAEDVPKKGGSSKPSYLRSTTSSRKKIERTNSSSTSNINKVGEGGRASPKKGPAARRSRMRSNIHDQKYKSTPDLLSAADDEDDVTSLSGVSSTDDFILRQGVLTDESEDRLPSRLMRRSMPVERVLEDFSSSEAGEGDVCAMREGSPTTDVGPSFPAPTTQEVLDRLAMPPPSMAVPKAKQDMFVARASRAPSRQSELTLAQAKAILMGKPAPDAEPAPQEEPTRDEPDLLNARQRSAPPSMAHSDPNKPTRLSELAPSPLELPVKDQPEPRSGDPSPSRCKSPFIGRKLELFEAKSQDPSPSPGRTRRHGETAPPDQWGGRRGSGSSPEKPAEGSPESPRRGSALALGQVMPTLLSPPRSSSMGDIKSSVVPKGHNLDRDQSASEEQMYESVQHRVAQYEMKSPTSQRRAVSNNRWRQRLLQVGEGDEGGDFAHSSEDMSSTAPSTPGSAINTTFTVSSPLVSTWCTPSSPATRDAPPRTTSSVSSVHSSQSSLMSTSTNSSPTLQSPRALRSTRASDSLQRLQASSPTPTALNAPSNKVTDSLTQEPSRIPGDGPASTSSSSNSSPGGSPSHRPRPTNTPPAPPPNSTKQPDSPKRTNKDTSATKPDSGAARVPKRYVPGGRRVSWKDEAPDVSQTGTSPGEGDQTEGPVDATKATTKLTTTKAATLPTTKASATPSLSSELSTRHPFKKTPSSRRASSKVVLPQPGATPVTTTQATPVQPSQLEPAGARSGDRSHLNLPVQKSGAVASASQPAMVITKSGEPETKPTPDASKPGPASPPEQAPAVASTKAAEDLTKAVQQAVNLIKTMGNTPENRVLSEALREARSSIDTVLPPQSPGNMETILKNYSEQLSEQVINLIKQKLDTS